MLLANSICILHQHIILFLVQLGIGKMYHCPRRSRGVLVKGDARNMFFRKDCSYQRMLEKCIAEIYTEEERENAEFYIADSRGIPIWSSDTIKIDVDNGTEELEWTLNHYIHLSNASILQKCDTTVSAKVGCIVIHDKTMHSVVPLYV